MEDVDCITISDSECNDDDEVEILDYFYNVEPITVDLTKAPPRRPFQQHQPQPESEPTPNKQGRLSPPEEELSSQKQQSQQQQQQQQHHQQQQQQPDQNSQFSTQGGTQSKQYIRSNNSQYVPPPKFFQPPSFLQSQRHPYPSFPSADPQRPPLFRQSEPHTQNNNFYKSQQHQHQPQPPKPPTVPPKTGRPTTQPRAQAQPQPSSKPPQQRPPQQQQQQRVQPQPPTSRPQTAPQPIPKQQPSQQQPSQQQPPQQQPPQHQPPQHQPPQQQPPQSHLVQQQKPVVHEQPTADKPPISDHDLMIVLKEQGNKKFRSNLLDEAVRLYREAGELARKLGNKDMSAILHFNLAMSYDKLGSHNQAADECAAAVKIDDKYMKAHCKRAEIYMSQGKFEEAVICYEHICEIDSSKREEAMRRISYAKELAKSNRKRDQYEILGLRPHFTAEQLKTSYKQKARAHHPDRHSDADIVTRRIQEKIFKEASEANAFFRKKFGYN